VRLLLLPKAGLRRPRLRPRWRQAPRIVAKIASGDREGALGASVDRHPAAISTPWARPESCRFLRLDLLHAIMDRLPVIGDWFRHLSVPPGFAALFQRRGRVLSCGQHPHPTRRDRHATSCQYVARVWVRFRFTDESRRVATHRTGMITKKLQRQAEWSWCYHLLCFTLIGGSTAWSVQTLATQLSE
jgi:hypothetical protein